MYTIWLFNHHVKQVRLARIALRSLENMSWIGDAEYRLANVRRHSERELAKIVWC